jgi:hypothetical protein
MSKFIGTMDDYHKFIGPRIRNIVNTFTKKERDKRQGICEFCREKKELQSAHKHGKERKIIIGVGAQIAKSYDKSRFDIFQLYDRRHTDAIRHA